MSRLQLTSTRDRDISKLFQRKVNKRYVPDYYDVIKEPMALSVLKQKIQHKLYKDFSEFVRDCALVSRLLRSRARKGEWLILMVSADPSQRPPV